MIFNDDVLIPFLANSILIERNFRQENHTIAGAQFLSIPIPHTVVVPANCLYDGDVHPPKAVKSNNDS